MLYRPSPEGSYTNVGETLGDAGLLTLIYSIAQSFVQRIIKVITKHLL